MGGGAAWCCCECVLHFPNSVCHSRSAFCTKSSPSSIRQRCSSSLFTSNNRPRNYGFPSLVVGFRRPASLPETRDSQSIRDDSQDDDDQNETSRKQQSGGSEFGRVTTVIEDAIPQENFAIIAACVVGLLTGVGVVLFNNAVHEIRHFSWVGGIPYRGASWLREEPVGDTWKRVILVPVCGGVMVGMLNSLRGALESPAKGIMLSNVKAALRPFLKAVAASVTLGTGNSLGPEGPSVEIGASIAKGLGNLFKRSTQRSLSLVAAGSAAGFSSGWQFSTTVAWSTTCIHQIPLLPGFFFVREFSLELFFYMRESWEVFQLLLHVREALWGKDSSSIARFLEVSGFNAAVAGCFFAVESVLWPSRADSYSSLTNTTSMVILSAVIASVASEVGLGSEPAFKVPEYDFRSPSELPLYLLLGILCGLVSLTLSRCTSYALAAVDNIHKTTGMSKSLFPVLGGLAVGLIALAYPEILYWGFENVDILLESRPFVKGLSAELLLQLVGAKIVATSLCRASGLVGGYYAPSLFIGAATGMAYGKFASYAISQSNPIFHLSILEVASPQAYGLVGMAATLSGVCQVPLTAVLLLFELTQDYRIVLPLLGAVGLSSWIASGQTRKKDVGDKATPKEGKTGATQQPERSSSNSSRLSSNYVLAAEASYRTKLCELESSLCVDNSVTESKDLEERIFVSQAMRTRYVTVLMSTLLTEAVTLMLAEKQSCAVIVDNDNFLVGLLTLGDIQEFSKSAKARSGQVKVRNPVSRVWTQNQLSNMLLI
ncbi:hypothetical protein HHK36_010531 [Tetracentron sinense]|uniref:Chloride channel protein n=1 Tax=Tetracentron sinense TaxID=13715 RepID=A0A834ZCY8_TETSI|nr:hypothetical protein HHK36_010531 [Tetracentron sinense]